ncbi:MAG TPA: hypothetical protein VK828_17715 [Terriglobales bacterium]|jgi:hypothetical protein|nr:hypothetical protein [Terriglobales bacterium]
MHCSEQFLVDLARGVPGSPEYGEGIKAHIASGCSICKAVHDSWSRVSRFAANEESYTPPENLVHLVKLGFASQAAPQVGKWTLASLVFDSFAQPLPAGVRSGALRVWQVIYEAEGLTVDLHFGRHTPSKAMHVVGQVFDKKAAQALQDSSTVELSTEHEQLIATAPITRSGEFYLEFEVKEHLWLSVKSAARNTVRIPITNLR